MQKIKIFMKNILIVAFLCIVYLILAHEFTVKSIIVGIAVAVISIIFTNIFICDINYHNVFNINIFIFLWYFPFLLYKIISSGIKTLGHIIKNNATCKFFYYQSTLDSDFKLNLLSNSITLTPGTVTVDRQDGRLLVMQMCKLNMGCDDSDIKKMEQRIDRI